ncbi:hypothetical protein SDC9_135682 [bioreactor metagenome]|uniref:Uncharacterized protein n=1 Tax=bioreactor metagenome TaxID=1076179 RepID=A0A645DHT9_9ZZZZ
MVLIGGPPRNRHHGQREHRARQVDERFQRIRQHAHRAGDPPGQRLEHNGQHRHRHRRAQQHVRRHPGGNGSGGGVGIGRVGHGGIIASNCRRGVARCCH